MTRALLLMVIALLGPAAWAGPGAPQDVVVDLACAPLEAEIGQPVVWTLIVEHPRGASIALGAEDGAVVPFDVGAAAADARRAWVELEPRRRTSDPIGDERTRTTFAWTVAALDSGERAVSGLRVDVDLPDRVVSKAANDVTLLVRSALGDGEDLPRPLAGFRPAPPGADGRVSRWLVPGAILGAVAVLLVYIRRRWRNPVVLELREGPLDELEALVETLTDAPGGAAELGYDLSHLLRRTTDTTLGEPRSPLTDLEWAAGIEQDERLPATLRGPLTRLVRDLEPLKYGGATPTRFALQDLLARARGPLEELAAELAEARADEEDAAEARGARRKGAA